jgi:hypothetical protein
LKNKKKETESVWYERFEDSYIGTNKAKIYYKNNEIKDYFSMVHYISRIRIDIEFDFGKKRNDVFYYNYEVYEDRKTTLVLDTYYH